MCMEGEELLEDEEKAWRGIPNTTGSNTVPIHLLVVEWLWHLSEPECFISCQSEKFS